MKGSKKINNLIWVAAVFFLFWGMTGCADETAGNDSDTGNAKEADAKPTLQLQEIWRLDSGLKTPESAIYDAETGKIFVSNVNENPWELDENGFISQLNAKGEVHVLEWLQGMDGPKGMGISGDTLFVADINKVFAVNKKTGELFFVASTEPENQLNDIAVSPSGKVLVSGSGCDCIFEVGSEMIRPIDNQQQPVFKSQMGKLSHYADLPGRPNGLAFRLNLLAAVGSKSGELQAFNPDLKTWMPIADSLGAGDGLVLWGEKEYIASDWNGRIFHVSGGKTSLLLDMRSENQNTADIAWLDENTLLVPTFFGNQLIAYKVSAQ